MHRGLTIIETVVFVAIFTTAIAAVSSLLIYFYKSNSFIIQQGYAVESARRGMETMVKEIREATYSDTGAYPVIEAAGQSFTFYSDIDKDTKVEKVRYFLEGTNFKKGEIEASGNPLVYHSEDEEIKILSDNVRNGSEDIFSYYNASSTPVEELDYITDTRMVKMRLVVNVVTGRPPGEFTLISNAQLRNLYDY